MTEFIYVIIRTVFTISTYHLPVSVGRDLPTKVVLYDIKQFVILPLHSLARIVSDNGIFIIKFRKLYCVKDKCIDYRQNISYFLTCVGVILSSILQLYFVGYCHILYSFLHFHYCCLNISH